jgi:hypothetical protein
MAKDRSEYIFQDKAGAWYARTTITDATGKRRNIKRRANSKREAKEILRAILSSLETDGSDAISVSRRTFNELADGRRPFVLNTPRLSGATVAHRGECYSVVGLVLGSN